jgi:hypothetical protein
VLIGATVMLVCALTTTLPSIAKKKRFFFMILIFKLLLFFVASGLFYEQTQTHIKQPLATIFYSLPIIAEYSIKFFPQLIF